MAILRACMLYAVCSFLHFTSANAQVIYYPGNASVLLQKTAADMASLLQQSMPGSVFTTQEAGAVLPSSGILLVYDSSISNNEACHVKKMDNGLLQFSAAEDNGLVAGIYRYLYQVGFRFYLPGNLWQKIPVLPSAIISIDTVYKTAFKYRNWFISGGYRTWIMDSSAAYNWNGSYTGANGFEWGQFMRRNFMMGAYRFQGHRGDIMNTAYYSILQNNPCYVASFNGSRTASKSSVPNVANTAAMQAWATAIEDVFTQKRNAIVGNSNLYKDQFRSLQYNYSNIGIEVPDGPRWATGADNSTCDKVNMSASNQAAILYNNTAAALARSFPKQQLQVYAYSSHANTPDASLRYHQNIDVQVPTVYQTETSTLGLLNRWYGFHKNVSEYHYLNLGVWSGETPDFDFEEYALTAARLKQQRSQGITIEASPAKFASIPLLRAFNLNLVNDISIEQSLQLFCNDMFGAAAQPIASMLKAMGNRNWIKSGRYAKDNRHILEWMFAQLKQADNLALNEPLQVQERIAELKAYLHYWIMYLQYKTASAVVERKEAAARLCLYLASIHQLKLVNSRHLINNLVNEFDDDASFKLLYNTQNGTAYLGGQLPAISWQQINENYIADAAVFGSKILDYSIMDVDAIQQQWVSGQMQASPKIDVKLGYTNGKDYYHTMSYHFYAPTAGSFSIKYALEFEMENMGQLNILVEDTRKALAVLYDSSFYRNNPAGQLTISVPHEGYYMLSISTKYKTRVGLSIIPGNNRFYKNEAYLGRTTEVYNSNTAAIPAYFFAPASLSKIYFSVNNSYTQGEGYLSKEELNRQFVFKNSNGEIAQAQPAAWDASLFYIEIPAAQQGKFWQMFPAGNRYNFCFVNISNYYWYASRAACGAAQFDINIQKLGDECVTVLKARNPLPGGYQWQMLDKGRITMFNNSNDWQLPQTTSPGALVTMYSSVGCYTSKGLANEAAYLQMKEACASGAALINDAGIQLYPNPTTGIVLLKENGTNIEAEKIEVKDMGGRLMQSITNTGRINMERLSPAIYYCIIHKNGQKTVRKIARL